MKITFPEKITHRIYETGSSFHVKQRSMGKASFLFEVSASFNKTLVFGRRTGQ